VSYRPPEPPVKGFTGDGGGFDVESDCSRHTPGLLFLLWMMICSIVDIATEAQLQ